MCAANTTCPLQRIHTRYSVFLCRALPRTACPRESPISELFGGVKKKISLRTFLSFYLRPCLL
ncbi:unnamed protein product [Bubo scandiacus]